MLITQIKPGMVFKENDKRFERWVKVTRTVKNIYDPNDGTIEMICSDKGPDGPWTGKKSVSRIPSRFHAYGVSKGYTLVRSGWALVEYDKKTDSYSVNLHFETAPPESQYIKFACGRAELKELRDVLDSALVAGFIKKFENQ